MPLKPTRTPSFPSVAGLKFVMAPILANVLDGRWLLRGGGARRADAIAAAGSRRAPPLCSRALLVCMVRALHDRAGLLDQQHGPIVAERGEEGQGGLWMDRGRQLCGPNVQKPRTNRCVSRGACRKLGVLGTLRSNHAQKFGTYHMMPC